MILVPQHPSACEPDSPRLGSGRGLRILLPIRRAQPRLHGDLARVFKVLPWASGHGGRVCLARPDRVRGCTLMLRLLLLDAKPGVAA